MSSVQCSRSLCKALLMIPKLFCHIMAQLQKRGIGGLYQSAVNAASGSSWSIKAFKADAVTGLFLMAFAISGLSR